MDGWDMLGVQPRVAKSTEVIVRNGIDRYFAF